MAAKGLPIHPGVVALWKDKKDLSEPIDRRRCGRTERQPHDIRGELLRTVDEAVIGITEDDLLARVLDVAQRIEHIIGIEVLTVVE